jgi:hypothetical protein
MKPRPPPTRIEIQPPARVDGDVIYRPPARRPLSRGCSLGGALAVLILGMALAAAAADAAAWLLRGAR